jgi:hypothetical protein
MQHGACSTWLCKLLSPSSRELTHLLGDPDSLTPLYDGQSPRSPTSLARTKTASPNANQGPQASKAIIEN